MMPTEDHICVFFDLDETLFVDNTEKKYLDLDARKNLTKFCSDLDIYFIFLEETAKLFHWLLEKGVNICFATTSRREKNKVLPILEQAFKLPEGTLKDARFWNKSIIQPKMLFKYETIMDFQKIDLVGRVAILVDNKINEVRAANISKIQAFLATGFSNDDSTYLTEIREYVQSKLGIAEPGRTRKLSLGL